MDIITAASAFSEAHQIIKTLLDLKVDSETLAKISALRSILAETQTAQLTLLEHNSALVKSKNDLEKELARLKTWEHEAKRYKLTQIQTGVFAHALKESEANGEPPHWICADCYNKGKKFILSKSRGAYRDRVYKCTDCGFSASIHDSLVPVYL